MQTKPQAHTARHRDLNYETTRWQSILHHRRATAGGALTSAIDGLAGAVVERVSERSPDLAGVDRDDVRTVARDVTSDLSREVFARVYDDPERIEEPDLDGTTRWTRPAHDVLGELPEFETLNRSVSGDPDLSALAAADLLSALVDKADDLFGEADEAQDAGAPERTPSEEREREQRRAAVRGAVRAACRAAVESADEVRSALSGLAPGLERAPAANSQESTVRMDLIERVRSDARLRDVLQRAGRIRRIRDRRARVRQEDAREEVVDVERGGDLARALPSELARFAHPVLRKVALRNLLERQMVQYRLDGTEPVGRGPVVLLLDESYSMDGDAHVWARAVGVATLNVARAQRRACTVVGFNGGVTAVHHVDAAGRCQRVSGGATHTDSGPAASFEAVVLDVATRVPSGGTSFDAPLTLALDLGAGRSVVDPRADLLFVTDGQASVGAGTLERIRAARAGGLRVFGMTVNGGSVSSAVRDVCDEVVDIDQEQDAGAAIGQRLVAGGGR